MKGGGGGTSGHGRGGFRRGKISIGLDNEMIMLDSTTSCRCRDVASTIVIRPAECKLAEQNREQAFSNKHHAGAVID